MSSLRAGWSSVECLLDRHRDHLAIPWDPRAASAERVWFLVYPPAQERRLLAWLPESETATRQAGYNWWLLDTRPAFAEWMASLEYRQAYFGQPDTLEPALEEFGEWLLARLKASLPATAGSGIIVLAGVGSLFGFLKVSWLVERLAPEIPQQARLLVFFPGTHEQHHYRLLDARDGWDYLAVPIKC